MKLYDAITEAVVEFGKDILVTPKVINILVDYNAFEESRALKLVLKTMIAEGYIGQLLNLKDWSGDKYNQLVSQIISATSFNELNVRYIVDCIGCGLGYISQAPGYAQAFPNNNSELTPSKPNIANPSTPAAQNQTSNQEPWKRLSVEEREAFLNSLVEIKQSQCGLTYNSIYIADDSNDSNKVCFYINYEVSGQLPKDACVNLSYAIYDSLNRLRKKELLTSSLWPQKKKTYNIVSSSYVNLNFKYSDIGRILIFIED